MASHAAALQQCRDNAETHRVTLQRQVDDVTRSRDALQRDFDSSQSTMGAELQAANAQVVLQLCELFRKQHCPLT
jgi:predicted secreted Zn-dependent protease